MAYVHNNLKTLKIGQIVKISHNYGILSDGRYKVGTLCVIKHIGLNVCGEYIFIVEIPIGSINPPPLNIQEYKTVALHPEYLECL